MATIVNFTYYCYLFSICIISTIVVPFIIKICTKSNKARYPPSPPTLPFIGHFHLLSKNLPKSLESLASRYGPLMQIQMGGKTFVVVSNATLAEEILKTQDVDFASKFSGGPVQYNIYKETVFINGPNNKYWRFMKKLCVTKLFAGSQLVRFIHIREQETMKLIKSLLKRSREGEPCDLSMELATMTNNMMYKMALGKRCSKNPNQGMEIRKSIQDIMLYAAKLSDSEVFGPLKRFDLFGNGKKVEAAMWRYDQLLEQIMKDYENNEMSDDNEEKDVMDILLAIYKDTNSEVKLTRAHIKSFFMEIFMAAVDTTAATIRSAMVELLNNPKIFKKLREEIESVVGSRLVKESDFSNLPYLQAVLKETLRLHPAGPLLRRQCNIDSKINGYDIKEGTGVFVNVYAIMREPSTWKEPEKFLPERFLINHYRMDSKGQDFHFLPFGRGRRACLGASHASFVMHVTIAALVQCFDWTVKGGDKIDIVTTGTTGATPHHLVCYPLMHSDPFKA